MCAIRTSNLVRTRCRILLEIMDSYLHIWGPWRGLYKQMGGDPKPSQHNGLIQLPKACKEQLGVLKRITWDSSIALVSYTEQESEGSNGSSSVERVTITLLELCLQNLESGSPNPNLIVTASTSLFRVLYVNFSSSFLASPRVSKTLSQSRIFGRIEKKSSPTTPNPTS